MNMSLLLVKKINPLGSAMAKTFKERILKN
jgi:hypothetical protein